MYIKLLLRRHRYSHCAADVYPEFLHEYVYEASTSTKEQLFSSRMIAKK